MTTLQSLHRISLKNILLPTDFSSASGAALPYALAFVRLYGARLTLTNVVAREPLLMAVPDRLPVQDELPLAEARLKLLHFAEAEGLEISAYRPCVRQGELAETIPELIDEGEIDLVVLGTHGRRGLKKMVLGSGAETIYRVASCPVLTVGPEVRPLGGEPWKIERILFPIDLSDHDLADHDLSDHDLADHDVADKSATGLAYALSLAEENQAEFVVVNAAPLVPWQHRGAVEAQVKGEVAGLIPPEATLWCTPEAVVRWEYPAEAIVRAAEDRQADLIVMGVKRASAARLSSHRPWPITSEVVSRAPCPVLTVRS